MLPDPSIISFSMKIEKVPIWWGVLLAWQLNKTQKPHCKKIFLRMLTFKILQDFRAGNWEISYSLALQRLGWLKLVPVPIYLKQKNILFIRKSLFSLIFSSVWCHSDKNEEVLFGGNRSFQWILQSSNFYMSDFLTIKIWFFYGHGICNDLQQSIPESNHLFSHTSFTVWLQLITNINLSRIQKVSQSKLWKIDEDFIKAISIYRHWFVLSSRAQCTLLPFIFLCLSNDFENDLLMFMPCSSLNIFQKRCPLICWWSPDAVASDDIKSYIT